MSDPRDRGVVNPIAGEADLAAVDVAHEAGVGIAPVKPGCVGVGPPKIGADLAEQRTFRTGDAQRGQRHPKSRGLTTEAMLLVVLGHIQDPPVGGLGRECQGGQRRNRAGDDKDSRRRQGHHEAQTMPGQSSI